MTEIAMIKESGRLVPGDPIAVEDLAAVPNGKHVLVTIKSPRNVRQFRLAWALADKLAMNYEGLMDREDAMELLKRRARHVRWFADPVTGKAESRTLSISWASLSQDAFNRLFKRFVWIVCNEIIPDLSDEDLTAEILSMVDGKAPMRRAA